MNTTQQLIQFVLETYAMILLLRAWLQYCKVDFYNPLSQTIVQLTQPILAPVRKFVPPKYNLDLAAILVTFVLLALKYPLLVFIEAGSFDDWTNALIIGALSLIKTAGTLFIYAIFIRSIMSWFDQGNAMSYVLYQITEPMVKPVRRFMPQTGMIDFVPMIVVFILYFANNYLYQLLGLYWVYA